MPVLLGYRLFELRGTFGKRVVGVVGARGTVQNIDAGLGIMAAVDKKTHTTNQIFDADHISGKEHLVHAAKLALTARTAHTNFAESFNIELVCWAAGARQINQAFERVGLHKGCERVALLTVGNTRDGVKRAQTEILRELGLNRDDRVLEVTAKKIPALMKTFGIQKPEQEIAPIQKLVLEKVALLSLQR